MSDVLSRTQEIVTKAKSLGATEAIAKTNFGKYRQTRFSNNEIDITVAWNDYVTDVTLSLEKKVVATQIRDFQEIDEQLRRLIAIAKVSKENPLFAGFAKGEFSYAKVSADKRVAEMEDPSKHIFEAVEAAKSEAGPNVNCGGILFTKLEDIYLSSSEGPEGIDRRSAIELSIRVFSQREASGHSVECSSNLDNFHPARTGSEAGETAKLAMNPKVGDEGVYTVVFAPLFAGSMLSTWASMVSAFNVMTQLSAFVNKLGEKVSSEIVTIGDNPAPYSISHCIFDDEGAPTRKNMFIEDGILKTYLHNTSTAKAFKTETTGNAGLVVPNAWNVEMKPGDMSKEQIFGEVRRGLYLTNTWYTRFQNYAKGDFSTIPRDGIFLLENGEVKQSLKDIRLSDNCLNILNNIAGVSKERKHVHWWGEADPPSLAPYILVKDVHITKSR